MSDPVNPEQNKSFWDQGKEIIGNMFKPLEERLSRIEQKGSQPETPPAKEEKAEDFDWEQYYQGLDLKEGADPEEIKQFVTDKNVAVLGIADQKLAKLEEKVQQNVENRLKEKELKDANREAFDFIALKTEGLPEEERTKIRQAAAHILDKGSSQLRTVSKEAGSDFIDDLWRFSVGAIKDEPRRRELLSDKVDFFMSSPEMASQDATPFVLTAEDKDKAKEMGVSEENYKKWQEYKKKGGSFQNCLLTNKIF